MPGDAADPGAHRHEALPAHENYRSQDLRCGQPAAFLRRAHEGGDDATDDAALVEAAGGRVVVVDGDRANLKITGPDDLVQAEMLLTRRSL